MTKNRLASVATSAFGMLALFLLASCAEMPAGGGHGQGHGHGDGKGPPITPMGTGPYGHPQCPSGQTCKIGVTVANNSCSVDQPMVDVDVGVLVQWHLNAPAGWKFKSNGVVFQPLGPSGVFDQPSGGGSRVFSWHVKSRGADPKNEYKVYLEDGAGHDCIVDPSLWV